jgi:hypothetical protein
MTPRSFGIEGITDEDRAYHGSRFSDVREALFANPYQRTWGAAYTYRVMAPMVLAAK